MRAPAPFVLGWSKFGRVRTGRSPFALSVRRGAAGVEARLALLAVSFLTAACTADFTPRSVLDDLRVIALVASPLEAGPSEDVGMSATTIWPPGGANQEERWTFCPLSVGASAGYACAAPQCETQLPTTGGGVTFNPGNLTRACAAQLAGQGPVPTDIPDQLVTLVRYVATFTDRAGGVQTREAVQRLTLYTKADPTVRNHAPIITGVQIGGRDVLGGAIPPTLALGQGLEVRVLVDPASAEPYVDASGTTIQESIVVSYYTTAGRFDYDRASGPDARVQLNHESIPTTVNEALVYVVARDLRGGESVMGPFRVPVAH